MIVRMDTVAVVDAARDVFSGTHKRESVGIDGWTGEQGRGRKEAWA